MATTTAHKEQAMNTITTAMPKKITDFIAVIEEQGLTYEIEIEEDEGSLPSTRYEITVQHPIAALGCAVFYFRTSHPSIIRERASTRYNYGFRLCMGEMRDIKKARDARFCVEVMGLSV